MNDATGTAGASVEARLQDTMVDEEPLIAEVDPAAR